MKPRPTSNRVAADCRQVLKTFIPKSPIVAYPRELMVALDGDDRAAAFLSHILFLMERSEDEGGWVYHSQWHLSQHLGLTRKNLQAVRRKLKHLIEYRYDRRTHRAWFRVIPTALHNLLAARAGQPAEWDTDVPKPKFAEQLPGRTFPKQPTVQAEEKHVPGSEVESHEHVPTGTIDIIEVFPTGKRLPLSFLPGGKNKANAKAIFFESDNPTADTAESGLPGREAAMEPKNTTESLQPRSTSSAHGVDYHGLSHAAIPLPEDHDDRVAVSYRRGSRMVVSSHSCFLRISRVPVATKLLMLFPGEAWDESTARMFFRRYLQGRFTAGFIRYLFTQAKGRFPGLLVSLRTFLSGQGMDTVEAGYRETLACEIARLETEYLEASSVLRQKDYWRGLRQQFRDLNSRCEVEDANIFDPIHKGKYDLICLTRGWSDRFIRRFPEMFKMLALGYDLRDEGGSYPLDNIDPEDESSMRKFKRIRQWVWDFAVEDASFRADLRPSDYEGYKIDPFELTNAAWDYLQERVRKLAYRGWNPGRMVTVYEAQAEADLMAS